MKFNFLFVSVPDVGFVPIRVDPSVVDLFVVPGSPDRPLVELNEQLNGFAALELLH